MQCVALVSPLHATPLPTGDGSDYRPRRFARAYRRAAATVLRDPTPRGNGKAERFIQTRSTNGRIANRA
jgi:hypothetical protein